MYTNEVIKLAIEYKYTAEDLKTMQAWPLWKKIQVSQAKIIEWYFRHNGKVSISTSGGKDSMVLLDLARRCFPGIEAVYVNTGLDYPEVRTAAINTPNIKVIKPRLKFDEVVKLYGWCYPSKDVAHTIYYARKGSLWALERIKGINRDGSPSKYRQSHYMRWGHLLDAPFIISAKCCEIMKERPLEQYRKESGNHPMIGTIAVESQRRKQAWLQTGCNNFDSKKPISKPLSIWTESDILQYIKNYNIAIPSVYGDIVQGKNGRLTTTKEKRTGCIFCPVGCHLHKENRFQRLAETHPKLYKYCMNTLKLGSFLEYLGIPK